MVPADPEGQILAAEQIFKEPERQHAAMPYFSKGSRQYMPAHWILVRILAYMWIGPTCTRSGRSTTIRWWEEQKVDVSYDAGSAHNLCVVPGIEDHWELLRKGTLQIPARVKTQKLARNTLENELGQAGGEQIRRDFELSA